MGGSCYNKNDVIGSIWDNTVNAKGGLNIDLYWVWFLRNKKKRGEISF